MGHPADRIVPALQQTCVAEMTSPVLPTPALSAPVNEQLSRRRRRPGYKSRSKELRSEKRLQTFILNKVNNENIFLKSENSKLKEDIETAFNRQKEFFNSKHRQIMAQFKVSIDKKYENYFEQFKVENAKLKKHIESLEKQLTMAKKDSCKFHRVQLEPIDLSVPETPAVSGYVRVPRKLASSSLPGD